MRRVLAGCATGTQDHSAENDSVKIDAWQISIIDTFIIILLNYNYKLTYKIIAHLHPKLNNTAMLELCAQPGHCVAEGSESE